MKGKTLENEEIHNADSYVSSEGEIFGKEKPVAIEALKEKFLKLQDTLVKMKGDIQDLVERLHVQN